MREELEAHLVANPDDVAAHAAYADYLIEQGDPRGEFIRVQLALEDESLSKDERDVLRAREKELLAAHERDWLGGLAVPLLGEPRPPTPPPRTWFGRVLSRVTTRRPEMDGAAWEYRRGWLTTLTLPELDSTFMGRLAGEPGCRLLQELNAMYTSFVAPQTSSGHSPSLPEPCLPSVIRYRLGPEPEDGNATGFEGTADSMLSWFPGLRELRLFAMGVPAAELFRSPKVGNLRRLDYHHDHHYPLHLLAANPAFANLERLDCFPHGYVDWEDSGTHGRARGSYLPLDEVAPLFRSSHLTKLTHLALRESNMGDDGVQILVESGMLARLRVLDLSHGAITDGGAELLARHGRHLQSLNLSDNALSPAGVRALQEANVPVTATEQHPAGDDSYLYAGEFE